MALSRSLLQSLIQCLVCETCPWPPYLMYTTTLLRVSLPSLFDLLPCFIFLSISQTLWRIVYLLCVSASWNVSSIRGETALSPVPKTVPAVLWILHRYLSKWVNKPRLPGLRRRNCHILLQSLGNWNPYLLPKELRKTDYSLSRDWNTSQYFLNSID